MAGTYIDAGMLIMADASRQRALADGLNLDRRLGRVCDRRGGGPLRRAPRLQATAFAPLQATAVPEPGTLTLLVIGFAMTLFSCRFGRRKLALPARACALGSSISGCEIACGPADEPVAPPPFAAPGARSPAARPAATNPADPRDYDAVPAGRGTRPGGAIGGSRDLDRKGARKGQGIEGQRPCRLRRSILAKLEHDLSAEQKQYERAAARFREALPILLHHLPRDNPQVTLVVNELARALMELRQFDEAAALHEEGHSRCDRLRSAKSIPRPCYRRSTLAARTRN